MSPIIAPVSTDRASCISVKDAVLTPFQVTKHASNDRKRIVTGAVYSGGQIVPSSQRVGERGGDLVATANPEHVLTPESYDQVSGRWLYGGHWMEQFGHFITETATTLWPQAENVDGIIFHPFIFGGKIAPWHLTLIRRLGWNVPLMVARHGAVVEELVIPDRTFVLNESAAPEAAQVWSRIASPWRPHREVFLSRSELEKDSRRVLGDKRLDDLMAALGFDVLHPQQMSIEDQLNAVAEASVLAGVSGSALHLSAFTHPGTKVIEIGDMRSQHQALPNQRVIDGAVGRPSEFVPFFSTDGQRVLGETQEKLVALLGRS